jgi:glycosyltransferase involved in cell wall biosynthesis
MQTFSRPGAATASTGETGRRVMLVGPGPRFLSGITAYTFALANALGRECDLSILLMRRLLPRWLYPGAKRVGDPLTTATLPSGAPAFDGVDYYWLPSILRAARFLRKQKPDVLVFQWWSGTVLHTYLALAWLARRRGAKVVIEFHEVLDPGEQSHKWFSAYVRRLSPRLFAMSDAFVVHSDYDRALVGERYRLPSDRVVVIPHATYSHYRNGGVRRLAPPEACNLLFFGLVRPVKGLEDLVDAFGRIPCDEIENYWLTIVGETWEGWTIPFERVEASPYRDRISVVNRYVSDVEVDEFFGGADAVVLPYRKSSQSGVLHVAMAYGLPIVATRIGGLAEALDGYGPQVLVEAGDPDALTDSLRSARELRPAADPWGPRWEDSARQLRSLCDLLAADGSESIHARA